MSIHGDRFEMEERPTRDQQERLRDFLSELLFISRRYNMLIDGYGEDGRTAVLDLATGKAVGMELTYFLDAGDFGKIVGYDFLAMSILDGGWPVEGPQGLTELRFLDGRQELLEEHLARRQKMQEAR